MKLQKLESIAVNNSWPLMMINPNDHHFDDYFKFLNLDQNDLAMFKPSFKPKEIRKRQGVLSALLSNPKLLSLLADLDDAESRNSVNFDFPATRKGFLKEFRGKPKSSFFKYSAELLKALEVALKKVPAGIGEELRSNFSALQTMNIYYDSLESSLSRDAMTLLERQVEIRGVFEVRYYKGDKGIKLKPYKDTVLGFSLSKDPRTRLEKAKRVIERVLEGTRLDSLRMKELDKFPPELHEWLEEKLNGHFKRSLMSFGEGEKYFDIPCSIKYDERGIEVRVFGVRYDTQDKYDSTLLRPIYVDEIKEEEKLSTKDQVVKYFSLPDDPLYKNLIAKEEKVRGWLKRTGVFGNATTLENARRLADINEKVKHISVHDEKSLPESLRWNDLGVILRKEGYYDDYIAVMEYRELFLGFVSELKGYAGTAERIKKSLDATSIPWEFPQVMSEVKALSFDKIYPVHLIGRPDVLLKREILATDLTPIHCTLPIEKALTIICGRNRGGKTVTLDSYLIIMWAGQSGLPTMTKNLSLYPRKAIGSIYMDDSRGSKVELMGSKLKEILEMIVANKDIIGDFQLIIDEFGEGTQSDTAKKIGLKAIQALLKVKVSCILVTQITELAEEAEIMGAQCYHMGENYDLIPGVDVGHAEELMAKIGLDEVYAEIDAMP